MPDPQVLAPLTALWLPLTFLILVLGLVANLRPFRRSRLLPIAIMALSVLLLAILTSVFLLSTVSPLN